MKVDNNGIGPIKNPQHKAQVENQERTRSAPRSPAAADRKLELSPTSRLLVRARARAEALADARPDKIELARRRLASGYYDTPAVKDALSARLAALLKKIGG